MISLRHQRVGCRGRGRELAMTKNGHAIQVSFFSVSLCGHLLFACHFRVHLTMKEVAQSHREYRVGAGDDGTLESPAALAKEIQAVQVSVFSASLCADSGFSCSLFRRAPVSSSVVFSASLSMRCGNYLAFQFPALTRRDF